MTVLIAIALFGAAASPSTFGAPTAEGVPTTDGASTAEQRRLQGLGRKLFFDRSLSASATLSCADCHDPGYAYGPPPGKALALGGARMDQPGTRAVPSLRYLDQLPAFTSSMQFADGGVGPAGGLTWDGRAATLREQALIPLLAPNEMANRTPAEVVSKLRRTSYASDFRRRGDPLEQALRALEAFQRTPSEFYPYSSKYDAWLRGEVQLSAQERRGLEVFNHPDRGNCANCHPSQGTPSAPPSFSNYQYLNIGVPRNTRIAANADPRYYDMGLCGPSRSDLKDQSAYCGMFRTPTLRNVARRDAFFHNGVFGNLRQVLQFYAQRDTLPWLWYPRNPDGTIDKADDLPVLLRANLDMDAPFDGRFGGQIGALSDQDIEDLLAFLQTLSDG
jgi:cytochrome c peroxidase